MDENRTLDALEARLLGVLIEKALTTPEQYPLSLHAVTLGANQKSNRDPVLEVREGEADSALARMIVKGWAGSVSPAGGRVEKFRHNAAELLEVGRPQLAVIAELLLRGPQQPGELRQRAARMAPVPSQETLREILGVLVERGFAVRYDPEPGARAESYGQTLAPAAHAAPARAPQRPASAAREPAVPPAAPTAAHGSGTTAAPVNAEAQADGERRLAKLEDDVRRLRRNLDQLAWKLGEKLDA